MKRIPFLLFAVGLTANMTVMAGMSTSKVRKETRFLTDKMAYELSLSTHPFGINRYRAGAKVWQRALEIKGRAFGFRKNLHTVG